MNTQTKLVHVLKERKMHIAAAESLTGGLVVKMITEVPGASGVIECGICSYSNRIKHELLGVSERTLAEYTEYSMQTACEMAEGVRKISGADIAVSTTGIAGPGGGTPGKPVGIVYVGISTSKETKAFELRLGDIGGNDRETIRTLAAENALRIAIEALEGLG